MASFLLSNIATSLYSINPRLCEIPPRGLADEFCYCGSGDDGSDNISNVLCQDLDPEHALSVGSWLLTPERIVLEAIVGIVICYILLLWLIHKLREISNFSTQQQQRQHHQKIKHPKGVRIISLLCLTIICWYKLSGFQNQMYFLVMPCNIQWVLSILQCYLIPDSFTFLQFCILQLRITYIFSVIIAIVTPETGDCTRFGEYEFYWFNHFILLILPLLYINNGSISCFPPRKSSYDGRPTTTREVLVYNAYWWLFSCLVFYLFYFVPVTIMSVHSGLNLNFMLHPPHDHFILKGESFRLVATTLLAACYIFSRLLCLTVEKKYCMATTTTDGKFKQTRVTKQL